MALPVAALEPLRSLYGTLLDTLESTFGLDPSFIVNLALTIFALGTFFHYASGHIYRYSQRLFLSSVHINEDDQLYAQVMKWMTAHQLPTRAFRSVKATTPQKSSWEDEEDATRRISERGEGTEFDPARLVSYRSIIGRMPIHLAPFEGSHVFRHGGSWILFSHRVHKGSPLLGPDARERGYIHLECLGRSLGPIESLLGDVQTYHLERSMSTTTVFRALTAMREMLRWTKVVSRPSRDIRTVILDREKKLELLRDVNEYLHPKTRRWYANHGIPYRRGYLFTGAPGTGKTSLTSALAGVFGLDIYVLSLLDPAMNESQLMRLMSEVPSRCIVLLEDVDAAGLGKRSDTSGSSARNKHKGTSDPPDTVSELISSANGISENKQAVAASGISLSALLNAIDGVASHEGRILVMTTNAPDCLDPALVRPGRVDMQIHFELPSRSESKELFLSMYSDDIGDSDSGLLSPPIPSQTANGKARRDNTKSRTDETKEKKVSDLDFTPTEEIEQLANKFADALPEGKLSLADIQGFMLAYKRNPQEACRKAEKWASDRLREMEAN